MEGYANAIPSVTVPNSTCGIPRGDAFNLFRDPVGSDLPWPGIILGMSIPSMWYWCSDQVAVRFICSRPPSSVLTRACMPVPRHSFSRMALTAVSVVLRR